MPRAWQVHMLKQSPCCSRRACTRSACPHAWPSHGDAWCCCLKMTSGSRETGTGREPWAEAARRPESLCRRRRLRHRRRRRRRRRDHPRRGEKTERERKQVEGTRTVRNSLISKASVRRERAHALPRRPRTRTPRRPCAPSPRRPRRRPRPRPRRPRRLPRRPRRRPRHPSRCRREGAEEKKAMGTRD